MLEVYPEMITQLNAEAFVHIIKTLDFGLSQVTFPHNKMSMVHDFIYYFMLGSA